MSQAPVDLSGQEGADERPAPLNSIVARVSEWLCNLTLVAMLVIITAEAVARLFGHSLEMADEVGGYLLVAISFLSLAVCQVSGSFHHLELLQPRLSDRGRAIWSVIFNVLSLACTLVIFWQLCRLEMQSWSYGDVAPTELQTPLWLPRITMPLGMFGLSLVLLRSLFESLTTLGRVLRNPVQRGGSNA
jgi:TRAP-type C4-dicarboxylate transport system permease small subunit